MSTLQDKIAEEFLTALTQSGDVELHVVDQLRSLLDKGSKPKVDELVGIFTSLSDKEVK